MRRAYFYTSSLVWAFAAAEGRAGALGALDQECRQETGQAFDVLNGCSCPDGNIFTLDRQLKTGACRKVPGFVKELLGPWSRADNVVLGADKVLDPDTPFPELIGSQTVIDFSSAAERRDYFESIQDWDGNFRYWHPHLDYYTSSTATYYFKNFPEKPFASVLQDFGLRDDLLSSNIVGSRGNEEAWNNTSYYAPDLKSLLLLTGQKEDQDALVNVLNPGAAAENPHQELLARAHGRLIRDRLQTKDALMESLVVLRGNDCKDLCRMSAPLARLDDYSVTYHQEILRGLVQKRFLILTQDGGAREIILQMAPNFFPSMVLVREYRDQQTGGQLEARIFDKDGRLLTRHVTPVFDAVTQGFIQERRQPLAADKPAMFSCEGLSSERWDPVLGAETASTFFFGPERHGFGWRKSTGSAISDLGVIMKQSFGTAGIALESTGHLWRTSAAARSVTRDIQILPLGFEHCVEAYESWAEAAEARQVKVVAIPRKLFYEKNSQACEQQILKKVESPSGKNMLWVVSAGNDGLENPQGDFCLSSRVIDNVITVAAAKGSGSQIAAYSNFGKDHADILADGDIEGGQGTSFAAPRVAALAAKIAAKYPRLSPAEIKQAVMIGASPAAGLKEKIRSSAWLDFKAARSETRSLKAASCFTVDTADSKKECLGIRRCGVRECRDTWSEELKLLRDRQLLDPL